MQDISGEIKPHNYGQVCDKNLSLDMDVNNFPKVTILMVI